MLLDAVPETQDSQAIFDAHQALFGVASGASSPGSARLVAAGLEAVDVPLDDRRAGVACARDGQARLRVAVAAGPIGLLTGRAGQGKKQSQADAGADDEPTTASGVMEPSERPAPRDADHGTPAAGNARPAPLSSDARLLPLAATVAAATAKMDTSQQTPTQANEDRDHHVFYGLQPSSPGPRLPQRAAHDEPRTLSEADTGAVNFGNLSDLARPSSQVSEDGGFDTTRGGWRANDRTSQLQSNPAQTPYKPHVLPPETPELPKNPFAAKPGVAAPFAGSQLFGQTQHSSEAVKISPASSRPSPNVPLNSISPHIMETSPLKNRTNVTSPPDIQTSSPPRPDQGPIYMPEDEDKTEHDVRRDGASGDGSTKEDLIPESPTDPAPKPFGGRQPLAQYEPMKQSQERKSSGDARTDLRLDNEYDEAFQKAERRKRAERKRAQAAEEMEKISFAPGSRRDPGGQPSRKKRRTHGAQDDAADPAPVTNNAEDQEGAPTRNSPRPTAPASGTSGADSIKATPAQSAALVEAHDEQETASQSRTTPELAEEEMIPATSPAPSAKGSQGGVPWRSEPELPVMTGEGADKRARGDAPGETSSGPPTRRRAQRTYGTRTRRLGRHPIPSSSTSDALPAEAGDKGRCAASTLESPLSTASTARPGAPACAVARHDAAAAEVEAQQPGRRGNLPSPDAQSRCAPASTRSPGQDPVTPLRTRSAAAAPPPSSSLTTLSRSSALLADETPGTPSSLALRRPASLNMSPSTTSTCLSKRTARTAPVSESPQVPSRAARFATRSTKLDSDTTDELHQSPPPSGLEKSATYPRRVRSFRQSINSGSRGRRLFENMAFALSSQSDKPEPERSKLEAQIVQAGGLILRDGFQELFAPPSVTSSTGAALDEDDALRLPRASAGCGFTALIADGHSRKAKYMQALALGLPCLGPQWIAACVGKGEVVDWEPYLLCAGASAVLGNAIRSRTLAPYAAAGARLADVVERRRRPLDGQSVLVLSDGRRGRGDARQQYLFLVRALGPRAVARAATARQAREALRERASAGRPFDWLYVDRACGGAASVLSSSSSAAAAAAGAGPKRKRAAAAAREPRVLTDELVIQSLILGRMVEAGEM